MRYRDLRGVLSSTVAVMAVAVSTPAFAQVRNFNIPAQSAVTGIPALAKQADIQLLVSSDAVQGKTIRALKGRMTVDEAIRRLLGDADLQVVNSDGKTYTLAPKMRAGTALQTPTYQAAQDVPQYDEIIVTAQKKEERITDVPISVSVFSAEALNDYKIEGGSELLRAIPNVAFSKSNFASYNFSIRGIGTKALSVSSDPAVAISYNNSPMIRNRLFEQEYFDVERIEVLRGPQGTLYGRNATGGVVNMITKKPELDKFSLLAKGEVGNYETKRLSGVLNIPLGSSLSMRAAGALTKRDGYDYNTITEKNVNGRNLWSTRVGVLWEPSEDFEFHGTWEHFSEDDNRSRTGKQLCHTDPGPVRIGDTDISNMVSTRGYLSQSCLSKSLYSDEAFGVPNGYSLPHIAVARFLALGRSGGSSNAFPDIKLVNPNVDPFGGVVQSRDLREIATEFDPIFRAKNDVWQGNIRWSGIEGLNIYSQTMYTKDNYYSSQDYNRFQSQEVFGNMTGAFSKAPHSCAPPPSRRYICDGGIITPNGVFDDNQLGASKRILGVDLVKSNSSQFFQEFRVQSDFDKNANFSLGLNYTKFNIDEDYYVFNNLFSAIARLQFSGVLVGQVAPECVEGVACVYIDPNPLNEINGEGHNYFRSRNVAETESYAIFGEGYFDLSDELKLTLGLRYTKDEKSSIPYKSQLLLGTGPIAGGNINRGYPASPSINQDWGRLTGRAVLDWKPDFDFTDDSLIYASYSRGYKGGGANPPSIDFSNFLNVFVHPETYSPESVNAFEIGTKNTAMNGGISFNGNVFYYDYNGYQVSQIVDRLALNENFNAEMWGAEIEFLWRATPRLRFNSNVGYLKTRIGSKMRSIDVMNRTQGNPEYALVKPWLQLPSSCVAPVSIIEKIITNPLYSDSNAAGILSGVCGGNGFSTFAAGSPNAVDYGVVYDASKDTLTNNGRGFYQELEGNELPNAPRWTFNVGGQYVIPLRDHNLTVRADYYKQGSSWARVYNTEIDRLKSWSNVNFSIAIDSKDDKFSMQFYVKNVFNNSPITDAFINSDDSGLTANLFVLDPRIFGFSAAFKM